LLCNQGSAPLFKKAEKHYSTTRDDVVEYQKTPYRVNVIRNCDEDEKEEEFGQESEKGFSTSDLRG
jgi:hypothetical protein